MKLYFVLTIQKHIYESFIKPFNCKKPNSSALLQSFAVSGTRCCNQRQISLKFVMKKKKKFPPRLLFQGDYNEMGILGAEWAESANVVPPQVEAVLKTSRSCYYTGKGAFWSSFLLRTLQQTEALRWKRNVRTEEEQNSDLKGVFVL